MSEEIPEPVEMPDASTVSARPISTTSAFGGPPPDGRNPEDRIREISHADQVPDGGKKRASDLDAILKGQVPGAQRPK